MLTFVQAHKRHNQLGVYCGWLRTIKSPIQLGRMGALCAILHPYPTSYIHMISPDFKKWPLHDAIVESFVFDWEEKTCKLNLSVFLDLENDAEPCQIVWTKVSDIHIPNKAPWGNSLFINDKKLIDQTFILEMQSGDEIRIIAEDATLIKRAET